MMNPTRLLDIAENLTSRRATSYVPWLSFYHLQLGSNSVEWKGGKEERRKGGNNSRQERPPHGDALSQYDRAEFSTQKETRSMKRMFLNTLATVPAVFALLTVIAAPVSAQQVPFYAAYAGTAGFTVFPTSGKYDGLGAGMHLGMSRVHGDISVLPTAPSCPPGVSGGFTAQHSDTLTAANGDTLKLKINEDACPVAPNVFHCIGTYSVTGGTGRFARATGAGVFVGDVNFSPARRDHIAPPAKSNTG
jgi:hypothetical protein